MRGEAEPVGRKWANSEKAEGSAIEIPCWWDGPASYVSCLTRCCVAATSLPLLPSRHPSDFFQKSTELTTALHEVLNKYKWPLLCPDGYRPWQRWHLEKEPGDLEKRSCSRNPDESSDFNKVAGIHTSYMEPGNPYWYFVYLCCLTVLSHDKCSAEICWITEENNEKHIFVAQTLIT